MCGVQPLDKHVPRVLEGWDLWAALVKFCGYTMVAWLYVWLPTVVRVTQRWH